MNALKKIICLILSNFYFDICGKHIDKRNKHHEKAWKYFLIGDSYLRKGKEGE